MATPKRNEIALADVGGVPIKITYGLIVGIGAIAVLLTMRQLPAFTGLRALVPLAMIGIVCAVMWVGSLFAHELGHAVVAKAEGLDVVEIRLWALGGTTRLATDPPTATNELKIALAGPLVSLGLAGVSGLTWYASMMQGLHPGWQMLFGWTFGINTALGLWNLAPVAPLDGGKVLSAIFWKRTGNKLGGQLAASRAGQAAGVGIASIGAAGWAFTNHSEHLSTTAAGAFLVIAARGYAESARVRNQLGRMTAGDLVAHQPTVPATLRAGDAAAMFASGPTWDWLAVVDSEGQVVGVLAAGDATGDASAATAAGPVTATVDSDDAAIAVAEPLGRGADAVAVVTDGTVVGAVGTETLVRAARAAL